MVVVITAIVVAGLVVVTGACVVAWVVSTVVVVVVSVVVSALVEDSLYAVTYFVVVSSGAFVSEVVVLETVDVTFIFALTSFLYFVYIPLHLYTLHVL